MLKTINGNTFKMKCEEKEKITVLATGYLFTPDGNVILVKDDQYHSNVFNEYINKFKENKSNPIFYENQELNNLFNESGIITYYGLRIKKAPSSGKEEGQGILVVPTKQKITEEQQDNLKYLCNSNKSIFSNRELVEVTVINYQLNEIDITLQEAIEEPKKLIK